MTKKTYTRPTATTIEMEYVQCIAASIPISEREAWEDACAPVRPCLKDYEDEEDIEWED